HQPDITNPDVGALVLAEPPGLTPAALPEAGYLDDRIARGRLRVDDAPSRLVAVGYGEQLIFPPPLNLPVEGVRRGAQAGFRPLVPRWLVNTQNPSLGFGGTGSGDSGGPFF